MEIPTENAPPSNSSKELSMLEGVATSSKQATTSETEAPKKKRKRLTAVEMLNAQALSDRDTATRQRRLGITATTEAPEEREPVTPETEDGNPLEVGETSICPIVTATAIKTSLVGIRVIHHPSLSGVFIDDIFHSSIFKDSALRKGMKILSVNGRNCQGWNQEQIAEFFRDLQGEITIVAAPNESKPTPNKTKSPYRLPLADRDEKRRLGRSSEGTEEGEESEPSGLTPTTGESVRGHETHPPMPQAAAAAAAIDEEAASSSGECSRSFRERLEQDAAAGVTGEKKLGPWRKEIREEIVKAYSLHTAINTLKEMLEEERVKSNPILLEGLTRQMHSMTEDCQQILNTPSELLTRFEVRLRELVQYQIDHDERPLTKIKNNISLGNWLNPLRHGIAAFLDGKPLEGRRGVSKWHAPKVQEKMMKSNIKLFQKLHIQIRSHKRNTFESYMTELREYKAQHGHIKVRRKTSDNELYPLGEWIARTRKEYDDLQHGKTASNLTPARIAELNDMGMVWRIRHGRPRKGDARFRLRRRSGTNQGSILDDEAVVAMEQDEPQQK